MDRLINLVILLLVIAIIIVILEVAAPGVVPPAVHRVFLRLVGSS